MTTVTFKAYQISQTYTYDPDTFVYDDVFTGFDTVEVEFTFANEVDGFSYNYNSFIDEFGELIEGDTDFETRDGDPLVGYSVRIDGSVIDASDTYSDAFRAFWDNDKETDLLAFDFEDIDFYVDNFQTYETNVYLIQMGGDDLDLSSLSDFEDWLETLPEDDIGDPELLNIDDGDFAEGEDIAFSDLEDFISISDDDFINAAFTSVTSFDLGKGDDVFIGSDADERVLSGRGDDSVTLGSGDDYVRVGGGTEEFYGGSGKDYISYYDSSKGVKVNLSTNEVSGSWASNDIVEDFESISGSKTGDDSITGTSGSNTIRTYGGDDRVAAGLGSDKIQLGDGNDYVRVGGGKETFDGGSGKDYISYYSSSNGIRIDLRDDEVSGSWAVNDKIKNFESASGSRTGDDKMLGTSGANTFKSYGGDDTLYGRGGSDKLYGGSGEDFLDGGGGSGTDLLYGGSGADIFEFDRGEGVDVIKDFENNIDTIRLDNFDFEDDDPYAFAEQVGDDVVFDFGSDGMLTIENTNITRLQNDLDVV